MYRRGMTSLRRALAFGFLVWLISLLPIRQSNRPLFESIIGVALAMVTASFLNLYFRRVERHYGGALLGIQWFAMSLLLDQSLFRFGPMKMPFGGHAVLAALVSSSSPMGTHTAGIKRYSRPHSNA